MAALGWVCTGFKGGLGLFPGPAMLLLRWAESKLSQAWVMGCSSLL